MNSRTHALVSPLHVIVWSLPSLVSVLLFGCVLAMSGASIWPRTLIAEVFFCWFLTITPTTIGVAVVRLMRYSRRKQLQTGLKALGWGLIVVAVTSNGVVLIDLLTAFYS